MKDDEFRALARRHALDALQMLAAVAVDQTASPSDREHARRTLELRLEQAGDDVPSDFRRNLEKNVAARQLTECQSVSHRWPQPRLGTSM
jgi:hypothetical protein